MRYPPCVLALLAVVTCSPVKHFLLTGILALLCAAPALSVCNVPSPRLVCAEYFASKVVVEATLVKVRDLHSTDDPEGILAHVYTFRSDRLLRGHVAESFRLYEGNDSGRATFEWKVGRKYLLFLFYSVADKSWALDGCGNSGALDRTKSVLEQIDAIQSNTGSGVIHGVVSGPTISEPLAGIHVEARGTKGLYKATTNARGEFNIKVPAGKYTVHAVKTGFAFQTADLSYENPQDLQIEPGGCAQVQLITR
jgi:Carboxypeptidase regulatory-like domain